MGYQHYTEDDPIFLVLGITIPIPQAILIRQKLGVGLLVSSSSSSVIFFCPASIRCKALYIQTTATATNDTNTP